MHKIPLTIVTGALIFTASVQAQNKSNDPEQWRDTGAQQVVAPDTPPSGSVRLHGGSVAAGVGYVWGHGTLAYGNKRYRFKLSGISVVDVGAASITASGDVYNLKGLRDFDGNYTAVTAGLTIAGGGSVAYLKNENGVVIKLVSTTEGLRFNLSADGVHIKLQHA
jgi:hypothetical protein